MAVSMPFATVTVKQLRFQFVAGGFAGKKKGVIIFGISNCLSSHFVRVRGEFDELSWLVRSQMSYWQDALGFARLLNAQPASVKDRNLSFSVLTGLSCCLLA
jgi:hypothetical protein